MGISFDSGYASFLDEVLRDDDSRQRITILEGPPSHRDIAAHRLRTLNLNDDILRFDKLEAQPTQYVDRRLSNVTPMTITPPATIAGMSPLPPPPATPSSTISNSNGGVPTNGAPPSSYATAIKAASPPPQVTLPIPPKQVKPAKTPVRSNKTPAWNPGVRGLDSPLEVNQSALDNIKKRKDHNKLCNNHYLRGPCAKGDACCFEHKYRPNEMEKTAIAFLARLNPCTSGQDCEVDDCIYGHHVSKRCGEIVLARLIAVPVPVLFYTHQHFCILMLCLFFVCREAYSLHSVLARGMGFVPIHSASSSLGSIHQIPSSNRHTSMRTKNKNFFYDGNRILSIFTVSFFEGKKSPTALPWSGIRIWHS